MSKTSWSKAASHRTITLEHGFTFKDDHYIQLDYRRLATCFDGGDVVHPSTDEGQHRTPKTA
jgi:hypothetical protein